jgi:acylglycerol lipase
MGLLPVTLTAMTSSPPYAESYIPGPQNTQFYTRNYSPPSSSPPKALLIAVHGFNEHVARYTQVHTPFAQRGIAVFAFDQRGFGLTVQKEENGAGKKYAQTSWKEQLEDIEWAVKEGRRVEGCGDVPVFLLGHSMVRFL